MKVLRTVTGLLIDILQRDLPNLGPGFALTPQNGVMPIEVAKLAIVCEKAFSLTLFDEKIAAWETVGDVCAHVEELLEEGLAEPAERTDADRVGWFYE